MGVITALAITAAVAGASAYAKSAAAKKAGAAQKKAISEQEGILRSRLNPEALNRLAQQVDKERFLERRRFQEEVDPELAKLRQLGKDELLKEFSRDDSTRQSTQIANQLFAENREADPRMEALKDSIINKAQSDLDKGAELPAEFQAELVRTGLSTGANAGIGTSRSSVGGVTSRLLGGAGIQLEAQRTAEAQSLAGTAQSLTASRASILSSIFPTVKAVEDAKIARAAGAFQLGESTIPQVGLSGSDAVNIEVARRNAQVAARGQRGIVNAQLATAQGNANAAYIQAAGSVASGAYGAYQSGLAADSAAARAPGPEGLPQQPYQPQPMGVSQAAFGRQSGVGTVPMIGQDFGGANIQFDPTTGKYVDVGMPGYRTPAQQALFNRISGAY